METKPRQRRSRVIAATALIISVVVLAVTLAGALGGLDIGGHRTPVPEWLKHDNIARRAQADKSKREARRRDRRRAADRRRHTQQKHAQAQQPAGPSPATATLSEPSAQPAQPAAPPAQPAPSSPPPSPQPSGGFDPRNYGQ